MVPEEQVVRVEPGQREGLVELELTEALAVQVEPEELVEQVQSVKQGLPEEPVVLVGQVRQVVQVQ